MEWEIFKLLVTYFVGLIVGLSITKMNKKRKK